MINIDDNTSWSERLFALTQSALALIVVVGGGLLMAVGTIPADVVVGLMGTVIGFYFGRELGVRGGQQSVLSAIERRYRVEAR